MKYLGIDIGGTWIKGTVVDEKFLQNFQPKRIAEIQIVKIKSPLHQKTTIREFMDVLKKIIASFQLAPNKIAGIGISTGGIVNYRGTKVIKAASHLNILKNEEWKKELEKQLHCPSMIVNDSDAATIALAETGQLKGNKTIGIMPVGTGIGFTVWRNGRRWRPGKSYTLLGSIRTPGGSFDNSGSATQLAALDNDHDLITVLTNPSFKKERELYFQNLTQIINTAGILYHLDEVIVCGGLADATIACNFPLQQILSKALQIIPNELDKPVKARVPEEGNLLQLLGALALAKGESIAAKNRIGHQYKALETEIPYRSNIQLQNLQTSEIVRMLWQAEQEAGLALESSLPLLSHIADEAVKRIQAGGRIIYVGAGTSGRIAAMDAVEIPCTYGFPEHRILSVIAGGVADAAIEIESDFEEDASAVTEMLLLNIRPEDVVVGISASASAYFVQSALAFAKDRKALSVLLKSQSPASELPFCDHVIPLNSSNEVVAGSTRMKAGTATKKVLNFLSSVIMIKLGKVAGPYMVDVACINDKLVQRAHSILQILYGLNRQDAGKLLEHSKMNLELAIRKIQKSGNKGMR
jgi:N-acetylmuramic acid 6-phosphate etherase